MHRRHPPPSETTFLTYSFSDAPFLLLYKSFNCEIDVACAVVPAFALNDVIAFVAKLLKLGEERLSADFAVAPRHFRAPGAGLLRKQGVLDVNLDDPGHERLESGERLALGVENHVGGIEVDAHSGNFLHELREVLGSLLSGLEDHLDAVLRALVAHPLDALDILLVGDRIALVEEARVKRHVGSAELLRELGALGDDLLVLGPVLIGNDAAGLLDRLERRVVFADSADHGAHELPLAALDLGLDEIEGLGRLGVAMAAVSVDERPESEMNALDARLLHLGGDFLHRLAPAPGADADALGLDLLGGDLADEHVAPFKRIAVALKFDLILGEDRAAAVPVVLELDVVDDENAVEPNGDALALHDHMEAVPVADLLIGDGESARRILLVVVQAARTDIPLVVGVPDLNLGSAAQIKAGVARDRKDAPVGPELEILVVALCGERIAALVAVEVEVAVADAPVLAHFIVGELLDLGALLGSRGIALGGIVEAFLRRNALPHGKVALLAGEISLETGGASHRLIGADVAHLGVVGKLLDADVLPLHVVAVAEPANGTFSVVEAGVLLLVGRIAVTLELRDVALGDEVAVEIIFNFAADNLDFGEIPHSGLADIAAAAGKVLVLAPDLLADIVAERGEDAVDRTGVLIGLKLVLLVLGVVIGAAAVIEELKLAHSVVGGVLAGNHAHAETVVAVRRQAEFKTENEIPVAALRIEVASLACGELALGVALENAVLERIHLGRAVPLRKIVTRRQPDKSLVNRLRICAFGAILSA